MYIGNVEIHSKLYLAPMAGVTDLAFRQICRELGAGMELHGTGQRQGSVLSGQEKPRPFEAGPQRKARRCPDLRQRYPLAWLKPPSSPPRYPAQTLSTSTWAARWAR